MSNSLTRRRPDAAFVVRIIGIVLFAYFFFGFMLVPCLNTLTQIFTVKTAAGETDPWAVIRFFFAGNMGRYVWNSLKLAICLVITVNVVGVSIVLLTEYFDIKGANILRLGYMTTMIYSGVALVTGYLFLYDPNGILTTALADTIPGFNRSWFSGFNAVLFTMTFACTSNHALFLRNAIRGIDYNTVEAARNMGAKPFKVLWKVVFPTLVPTMFSLTVMTFITGLCAMSAPTLLGYDSINPEIVRLAGSSVADESFPQARAALLSIILAMFTIVLLTVLSAYERKGHYLSVSKTKAKLVKQKITNPVWNVLAHIYAYVLFIIYMTPVVMIVIFSFQTFSAVRMRKLDLSQWTLVNSFGKQDYSYLTSRGTYKIREGSISGVFSNEAGLGTGSIAHACADTKKPVKQGVFGIFEVFVDTIVICTLTALVILCSGTAVNYGTMAGADLTISGFTTTYGSWASIFSAVALCCFAFSTIIGWGLYGSRFVEFLFRTSKAVRPFLVIYSFVAILGATVNLDLLWNIADTFNGLMSIPNLIALLLLSGTVVKLTKEFFAKEDGRKLNK